MGRSKTTRSTRSGRAFTTERAPASPVSRWSSGKTSRAKTTGVPCVPLKTGTTIGFPPRANAASSAGTTGSGVFGWSPSAISAARVHGLSAATPTAIELPCPSWGRGFTAKRAASPAATGHARTCRVVEPPSGRALPGPAGLRAGAPHRFGDRALREHAAEVRLVLDRTLQIRLDVHAIRRLLRGGLDRRRVEALAD